MPMIANDWMALRAEAVILSERLRLAATDEESRRLGARAQELQQLAWAARELLDATRDGRVH